MSELSAVATALLSKHKEKLGMWPNIRYIVFAFCDERMIQGVEDLRMVRAFPSLFRLIDDFLTEDEDIEDSHEALMVFEILGESFIEAVKHIEQRVGSARLTAV